MSGAIEPLLTAHQVADLMGFSVKTVRRMTTAGALPHYRIGPRAIRYRHSEVNRWISDRYVARVWAA